MYTMNNISYSANDHKLWAVNLTKSCPGTRTNFEECIKSFRQFVHQESLIFKIKKI